MENAAPLTDCVGAAGEFGAKPGLAVIAVGMQRLGELHKEEAPNQPLTGTQKHGAQPDGRLVWLAAAFADADQLDAGPALAVRLKRYNPQIVFALHLENRFTVVIDAHEVAHFAAVEVGV